MIWIFWLNFWAAKKRHFWFQLSEFQEFFFLKIENFHPKIDEINMQTEILKSTGQKRPATSWQTVFDGVTFQLIPTLEVSLEVNRIFLWFRCEDNGFHEEEYRM